MRHYVRNENSKWGLPKEEYLTALHYALRYPLWLAEIKDAEDTSRAITYDGVKVQTSTNPDMVFNAAYRAAELDKKVKMIDSLINECAKGMDNYLRLGVCHGLTFYQLKERGMPCEKTLYYDMRREFYYKLSILI